MAKATRPIFIPSSAEDKHVESLDITFEWFGGFHTSQKIKSMNSLHKNAKKENISNILEVSTKSDKVLGNSLSAFNLIVEKNNKVISLESAYQGSKVFTNGGPYQDLYDDTKDFKNTISIKKDPRIDKSFEIISFKFYEETWETEPKTAFYDWLYLNSIHKYSHQFDNLDMKFLDILGYAGFTDIEFNPKKSINCQARSCALFVSLYKKNLIEIALESKESFLDVIKIDSFYTAEKDPHTEKVNKQQKLIED